jgi:hypothetical protein
MEPMPIMQRLEGGTSARSDARHPALSGSASGQSPDPETLLCPA